MSADNKPARVETGVVQFDDDWPGVFFRGDNAFGYAVALKVFMDNPNDLIQREVVMSLMRELWSCDTRLNPTPRKISLKD